MPSSHTIALSAAQVDALRARMESSGFEFRDVPYAVFGGARPGVSVVVYEKGPKAVIQGKGADEFVEFVIEPEILGEARMGYEDVLDPEMFEPHFGIDESGKGDFFGPLVIAGAYTDAESARVLLDAGVADSKSIGSDRRVRDLARSVRACPGVETDVVVIAPARYNELYEKFRNLNRLLAWGHARVIENLCERRPDCRRAVSDQFAREKRVVASALMERGRGLVLEQRTKAESDIAVAAASVLARAAFVDWLDRASTDHAILLPKGGGAQATAAARELVRRSGEGVLPNVAKMHFRNASRLTL